MKTTLPRSHRRGLSGRGERPAPTRRLSMAHVTDDVRAVYELPLTDNGGPDVPGTYIYLPPPSDPAYSVRFTIDGTSSICRHGSLWVNIPEQGQEFDRRKFREYKLEPNFHKPIQIDVPVYCAGAFAFYSTYTPLPPFSPEAVTTPEPTQTPTYYIDVSPKLSLRGETLLLDSLSIFSVISKFMGKYPSDWDKHLYGISERGYNMVHYTPLQMRGDSNSPYSLYDQLQFDRELFPNGEQDIAELIGKMEKEYGLLSLTDVVLNHTANNSKWLEEHPESGYNVSTAPWMRPALELDTALLDFSSKLAELGLPTSIESWNDLQKILDAVKNNVLKELNLWQFYVIDTRKNSDDIIQAWTKGQIELPADDDGPAVRQLSSASGWSLNQKADWLSANGLIGNDHLGERYRRRVDAKKGAAFLSSVFGRYDSSSSENAGEATARAEIRNILDEMNAPFYHEYDDDYAAILEQLQGRIKYMRLDDHGPKMGEITQSNPLIEPYFTRLAKNETTAKHHPDSLALANNGWIWAADVLKDHAGSQSKAYLRREVIVWGDCVKLRYGTGPNDNPFLWDFMARYTRLMAKYFHGFRIDNCHSTPLHVAEYFLDEARKVRPNLVICAELFSGNQDMDFLYVERLGISCLIREAMQSWSTQEMSRLVHSHAGRPIGSFELNDIRGTKSIPNGANGESSVRERVLRIRQSPVHALFMDCTHDNEVPTQKRDARDTLPNAALVAMCGCATGSVMGYDELYPRLIELVHEKRSYSSPSSNGEPINSKTGKGGIGGVKQMLNRIHVEMGQEEYDETFIHHDGEYITIHRVHPQTHHGYFLIAHTAYPGYGEGNAGFQPVHLPGTKATLVGAYRLEADTSSESVNAAIDDSILRGIPSEVKEIQGVSVESEGADSVITVPGDFAPGSIALFETSVPTAQHSEGLDNFVTSGADTAMSDLTLSDLNCLLYRADVEERGLTGDGTYNVPGHGNLVYAGLQGWWSVLKNIIRYNELGHPLCQHLREGAWAMDYAANRLWKISKQKRFEALRAPAEWLESRFDAVRKIPSFLYPRYFALTIQTAYNAAFDRGIDLMSPNIQEGQLFLKQLSMVSAQVTGYMDDAGLWPEKSVPSLAAGLPHFASSWARCWGRDIFISLRGLYLTSGRFDDAKEHILAFGSVLKHGQIPNLLSDGKLPRYNSRDSIWFFTQNVQDYTRMVPNGMSLLQETTPRRFLPYDDTWFPYDDPRAYSQSSTIEDIVQEALQRHASGMKYREYNAGPQLDSQMKSEGFDHDIYVDWTTGFVYGGNQSNCGTWMDKMGESEKAGSKGVPGTPRDGAAVEITGLLYSTVRWVAELYKRGKYKYSGVKKQSGEEVSFEDWAGKIKSNFERCYYVPRQPSEDDRFDVNSSIVNRRGIYKDLYKSGKEYEDYQLRPNFPIAMTVAPDLFEYEHALHALYMADKYLLGPTGMTTLDPSDYGYRPYYNNDEDSTDFRTSKGRNYHSGPEWLWPTGFFLRALLKFDLQRRKTPEERVESFQQVTRRLKGCKEMIRTSPWAGLTELTNKDGSFCKDSCPTQSWSASCIMDLFQEAQELSDDAVA